MFLMKLTNIKVSAMLVTPEIFQGEYTSCLFQLLEAAGIPWLVATSLQSPKAASAMLSALSSVVSSLRCVVLGSLPGSLSQSLTAASVTSPSSGPCTSASPGPLGARWPGPGGD